LQLHRAFLRGWDRWIGKGEVADPSTAAARCQSWRGGVRR
jgi:hypothetical protein